MLDQVARHGVFDLEIEANGDLHIDAHHTVEDIGITLGQAFARAVGDKKGVRRYGHAYVPLDEALSRVVVDLSGRPGLEFDIDFVARAASANSTSISCTSFFRASSITRCVTLHIDNLQGRERAPPGRDGVQGVRPRAAHGGRARPAHAGRAVDQGRL